jgi:hypothetical protein
MRKTARVFLFGVTLASLLLTACTQQGASLVIIQAQLPDQGCAISGMRKTTYLPIGRIDIHSQTGYLFSGIAENLAEPLMNTTSRSVVLTGAAVNLNLDAFMTIADQSALRDAGELSFTRPFSGLVDAQATTGIGFEIVSIAVIQAVAQTLGPNTGETALIQTHITLNGTISGGGVKSPDFDFPVEVCNGCMINNLGPCPPPSGTMPSQGYPCGSNDLQDVPIDCCTNPTGPPTCPAK